MQQKYFTELDLTVKLKIVMLEQETKKKYVPHPKKNTYFTRLKSFVHNIQQSITHGECIFVNCTNIKGLITRLSGEFIELKKYKVI